MPAAAGARRALEQRLDPLDLTTHVVALGGRAGGGVGSWKRGRRGEGRDQPLVVLGIHEDAGACGTNSGGPPTAVATTERPQASASSVTSPNGSARLGWQTTSAAFSQRGIWSWTSTAAR